MFHIQVKLLTFPEETNNWPVKKAELRTKGEVYGNQEAEKLHCKSSNLKHHRG